MTSWRLGAGTGFPLPTTGAPELRTPYRPTMVAAVLFTLVGAAIGPLTYNPTTRIYDVWFLPATVAMVCAVSWPRLVRGRRRSALRVHAALFLASVLIGTVSTCLVRPQGDIPTDLPGTLLVIAYRYAMCYVVGFLIVALMLHRRGTISMSREGDVGRHALIAICVTILGAFLGALPFTSPTSLVIDAPAFLSTLRACAVVVMMVMTTFPVLFAPPPTRTLTVSWPLLVAIGAAIPFGVVVTSMFPDLPLSWTLAVPAVCAGLVMSQRVTASYMMLTCLTMIFYQVKPSSYGERLAWLPVTASTDVLLLFTAVGAMTLAVNQERRSMLSAQLHARAEQTRRERLMLDVVFQEMHEGLLLTDDEGRVALSNVATQRLLGVSLPGRLTAQWADLVPAQATSTVARANAAAGAHMQAEPGAPTDDHTVVAGASLARAILDAEPQVPVTAQLDHADDGHGPTDIAFTRHPLRVGDRPLTLVLIKDISAQETRRRQLEAFAGTVAHDLKGPLTALTGWMDVAVEELAESGAPESQAALARARNASRRMREIIDDYLAFTVAREGELHLAPLPLEPLMRDLVELYATAATEFPVDFDVDVPHVVHADASLARQLLANLVSNSVKYSRPGEPTFIHVRSLDDQPGWTQVVVADRGVGIQPGDEEAVFGSYARSDKDAASHQGIGLGLSLCHAIVTRHGGRISAERNEWGGATFRFTLPAYIAGEVAA